MAEIKEIFQVPATITKISTRVDRTFKVEIITQELDLPNETALLALRLRTGWLLFKESEFKAVPELPALDRDVQPKSPSQRLRAILFRIWENTPLDDGPGKMFEQFYAEEMEKIIDAKKHILNEITL